MSHTPGPWVWTDELWSLHGKDYQEVLVASSDYDEIPIIEVTPQDAALIAAAPDLLAACKCAANFFYAFTKEVRERTCFQIAVHTLSELDNAIAKAEGKP